MSEIWNFGQVRSYVVAQRLPEFIRRRLSNEEALSHLDFDGEKAQDDRNKWKDSLLRRLHFADVRFNERADEKKIPAPKLFLESRTAKTFIEFFL